MKKLLTLCLLAVTICAVAQKKTVAVLDAVDKQGKIPSAYLSMIRNTMITAITNTTDYEAYDRTSLDAIASEQNFQRSGQVDDEQIKRLGKMAGVDYVLVTEADAVDGWLTMIVKILNVETAKYEKAIDSDFLEMKPQIVQTGVRDVASKLFEGGNVYAPSFSAPMTSQKPNSQILHSKFANADSVNLIIMCGEPQANVKYRIISSTPEVLSTEYQYLGNTGYISYARMFSVLACLTSSLKTEYMKSDDAAHIAYINNCTSAIHIPGLTKENSKDIILLIHLSNGNKSAEMKVNIGNADGAFLAACSISKLTKQTKALMQTTTTTTTTTFKAY